MSKDFPFFALRRFAARLAVGLALVLPALTVPTLGAEAVTPLVGVDWLKAHLNDPNLVVLDIRSAIDGGGVKAYEAAHIPGSVHSDYDKAGWRVTRDCAAAFDVADWRRLGDERVASLAAHAGDWAEALRSYAGRRPDAETLYRVAGILPLVRAFVTAR